VIPGRADVRPAGRTCRHGVGHLTLPFCGDLTAKQVHISRAAMVLGHGVAVHGWPL